VLATTFDRLSERPQLVIYEPGRDPVTLTLSEATFEARLAGDLIAYVDATISSVSGALVVRNWRTGQVRTRVPLRDRDVEFDLKRDGSLVVATDGLTSVDPLGTRRRLPVSRQQGFADPQFAGDSVAVKLGNGVSSERVGLVSPTTGAVRSLGPRTIELGELDANDDVVGWEQNGCVLAARVDDPGVASTPLGPCPRAEAYLLDEQEQPLRGRTLHMMVKCISTPAATCQGELRARPHRENTVIGGGHFSVPVGKRRRVAVRLERGPWRRLRRLLRRIDGATPISVQTRTADPEGRVSEATDPFYLARP
jgi:hypothetical protein